MNDNKCMQQHFLVRTQEYADLLAKLSLRDRVIMEIGVGRGNLTKLLLAQHPREIIGYEIDPKICTVDDTRLKLVIGDFRSAILPAITADHCMVANPPYDLLPDIATLLKEIRPHLSDVILMIHPAYQEMFPEFQTEFILDRHAFDPPTQGNAHLVIRRGFS